MTLFEIVRKFENLALAAPNVRTASDGNVYEALNNNPTLKYGIFFVSQDSHQEFEQYDRYGLTLFYIDRLDDTLEDNRLQIQSIGKELLSTIIRDFCNEYDCDLPTMNYVPFTQKFKDLTAGVYVQITIEVFKDDCYDDYSEVVSDYQTKTVNITSNGTYSITPDSSHIALKEVIVNVDVQCSGCTPEQLEDAYNSGKTDQKNLLTSTAFTTNGNYTLENGWNNVTVNVPQDYTQEDLDNAFNSGHTSGMTDQKNLLVTTAFTENGTYSRENGYSEITVNVPQSGYTQDDLEDAYNSGKTDQKNLLTSTGFTTNGTYTRENGWNSVTVNVAQDYTQQDIDNAFNSGHTSGMTDQKNLLVSTAFTENGNYTRENGWNSVTVNIDTQAYYDSGYTDGYNDALSFLVLPDTLYFPSNTTNKNIAIISNGAWTVQSKPSWITLSESTGTGNATITASADANSGLYRTGNIVFSNGTKTITVSVQQEKATTSDYSTQYMTFNIRSGGTITWINHMSYMTNDWVIEYNLNDSGWKTIHSLTASASPITVVDGDNIKFRGDNDSYGLYSDDNKDYVHFISSSGCVFSVYGNIMSMIDSTNFESLTALPNTYTGTFKHMFHSCDGLITAQNLIMPATTLRESCYRYMFAYCSNLKIAPTLPATTLAEWCYSNMFLGCTSLNYIKCLATDISANGCTTNWVWYVQTTSGTFVKASSMNDWTTGENGIPTGWTVNNA